MQFKIKLNVSLIKSFIFSSTHRVLFENVSNLEKFNGSVLHTTGFDLDISASQVYLYVFEYFEPNPAYNYTKTDIDTASTTGDYFTFDCLVADSDLENLLFLVRNGLVELINANNTYIACYKQNDENDALHKKLTFVKLLMIQFKSTLSMKQFYIDLSNYEFDFNYIYIPVLKRYYYVNSVEMMNKTITRLNLQEDVLMSWENLIRRQSAFVTRYEGSTEKYIVDVRRPIEDTLTVEYITPTPTGTGSLVNTTLKYDIGINDYKIAVVSVSTKYFHNVNYYEDVKSPTGTNLPKISQTFSQVEYLNFMKAYDFQFLEGALINQSDLLSYVLSAIILPFDPTTPFTDSVQYNGFVTNQTFYAKDDALCDDYAFHDVGNYPAGVSEVKVATTHAGSCPYFIVADFTVSANNNDYLDYPPYSNLEIYIAFVGWVSLNASQILNKRLIVYYTVDFKSGMGTAYLYNVTDDKLIWSTNCQVGIKLDLTATNQIDNTRTKQSNNTNMILSLLTSALAIGVGVATENPVAIAGGALSAGKAVASTVTSNMMLFEKSQTNFGTGEGVFHAPLDVRIRRSYHKPLTITESVFEHLYGLPYNNYTALSALSGYVEVGDLHFDLKGEDIYQDEIQEIVQLLKNGVIF